MAGAMVDWGWIHLMTGPLHGKCVARKQLGSSLHPNSCWQHLTTNMTLPWDLFFFCLCLCVYDCIYKCVSLYLGKHCPDWTWARISLFAFSKEDASIFPTASFFTFFFFFGIVDPGFIFWQHSLSTHTLQRRYYRVCTLNNMHDCSKGELRKEPNGWMLNICHHLLFIMIPIYELRFTVTSNKYVRWLLCHQQM